MSYFSTLHPQALLAAGRRAARLPLGPLTTTMVPAKNGSQASFALKVVPVSGTSGLPGKEAARSPAQVVEPSALRWKLAVPLKGGGGVTAAELRALSKRKVCGDPNNRAE